MIALKEITADNLDEILSLKVAAYQKNFVATVAEALAQAWVYRETAFPFAIYDDSTPVGFVMLGYYESRGQYTLWKFLIDEKHQNKGYGKQALRLAVKYLTDHFGAKEIYTGVLVGNERAGHLYEAFGFAQTGVVENHMIEMKYVCEN